MRALVVADDLTGAHDCASRLAGPGGSVVVGRDSRALQGALHPPQGVPAASALVLDIETRFAEPAAARRLSFKAWRSLAQERGARFQFQKIDSTLRGNPGEEIEGFLQASAAPWIAVLPAYPAQGRQVRRGAVWVHGQRLDRSEYARDPLSPARMARPQDLFPRTLALQVPAAWLNASLPRRLKKLWLKKGRATSLLTVWKSATWPLIARSALKLGCRHFAGASALAGALAATARLVAPPKLPLMILAGSVSGRSFEQLRHWRQRGMDWRVASQPGSPSRALALSSLPGREALRGAKDARSALRALIQAGRRLQTLEKALWLLTGGHTCVTFFEEAALSRFWVLGQCLPGLAIGIAEGSGRRAWVASKPGAFGSEDLYSQLWKRMAA